jgi:hypothetical protein
MDDMKEIEEILQENQNHKLDDSIPTEEDFAEVEMVLNKPLPYAYKRFVELGGLNDLRFNHRVLNPKEIIECDEMVGIDRYLPFASNGCGDLFCWHLPEMANPPVVLWLHETKNIEGVEFCFTVWLEKNRF